MGEKSQSKAKLKMYGEKLSNVTKEKDPLIDEETLTIQEVEDDVQAEPPQEVNNTDKIEDDNDPTVREVYFCTNCLKKGLSEKEKDNHAEETGHKLEKIKVPKNMPIYI